MEKFDLKKFLLKTLKFQKTLKILAFSKFPFFRLEILEKHAKITLSPPVPGLDF